MKLFAVIAAAVLVAGAILMTVQNSGSKKAKAREQLVQVVEQWLPLVGRRTSDYAAAPTPEKRRSLEEDLSLLRQYAASEALPDTLRDRCRRLAEEISADLKRTR